MRHESSDDNEAQHYDTPALALCTVYEAKSELKTELLSNVSKVSCLDASVTLCTTILIVSLV